MTFRRVVIALALLMAAACSDDHGSVEDFCAKVGAVPELAEALDLGNIDAAVTQLDDLHDVAPDEIRDDVGLIAEVAEKVAAALSNPDPQAGNDELVALAPDLTAAAEASTRVTAYTKTTCNIDLSAMFGSYPAERRITTGRITGSRPA